MIVLDSSRGGPDLVAPSTAADEDFDVMDLRIELADGVEVSGLKMAEVVRWGGSREPVHSHDQPVFHLALDGHCSELYRNEMRQYRRFSVGFLPPGEPHSFSYDTDGMRWFRVDLRSPWMERLSSFGERPLRAHHTHGGPLSEMLMRLHCEYRHRDRMSPLVMEALGFEMIAEILRSQQVLPRTPSRWLARAKEYIEMNLSTELKLTSIADAVEKHPVHLAREFRRHFRCTVGDYIRSRRIDYVCTQLATSNRTLVDIAYAAGFCDQSHLSRAFKRVTGSTPGAYRNRSWRVEPDRCG